MSENRPCDPSAMRSGLVAQLREMSDDEFRQMEALEAGRTSGLPGTAVPGAAVSDVLVDPRISQNSHFATKPHSGGDGNDDPPPSAFEVPQVGQDALLGELARPQLSVRQRNAIDLLCLGYSDDRAARQIGVERSTVTRWRLYVPAFQAELNYRRQEVWGVASDTLRQLLVKSMEVLVEQLTDPDPRTRFRAARATIGLCGARQLARPAGRTDPGDVLDEMVRLRRKDEDPRFCDGPVPDADRAEMLLELSKRLYGRDGLRPAPPPPDPDPAPPASPEPPPAGSTEPPGAA